MAKILIVDDEPHIARLIEMTLERAERAEPGRH